MKRLTSQPVLSATLADAGMRLIDIGARLVNVEARTTGIQHVTRLAPLADYYACEPDAEAAARVSALLPQAVPWRSVTVFTEALASREGEATLYLTRGPGMSSLLEPDPEVANRFRVGPKFDVLSTTTVRTITLDHAAERYGFQDACFLKLDTQGTELDILESGPRLLSSVMGVYVESLFHPFYKGQSLFADVDTHLRRAGFSLFGLYRTLQRRAGFVADQYSRRAPVWAHCLYLREPSVVRAAAAAAEMNGGGDAGIALRRLLGLALTFDQFDLALDVVAEARRAGAFPEHEGKAIGGEVRALMRAMTRRLARRAVDEGSDGSALVAPSYRDGRDRD
jgi:FkbM family methyltransferase